MIGGNPRWPHVTEQFRVVSGGFIDGLLILRMSLFDLCSKIHQSQIESIEPYDRFVTPVDVVVPCLVGRDQEVSFCHRKRFTFDIENC